VPAGSELSQAKICDQEKRMGLGELFAAQLKIKVHARHNKLAAK